MFDYSSMLKRAIEYFPVWTDIRKRYKKSIGGKVIDSALKETLELESALQDYIDFYFLEKYNGKENEVIAFVYGANTGKIENPFEIDVTYNDKLYVMTTDIDQFYKDSDLCYYEDGVIYIQEKEIKNDINKLILNIDSHMFSYNLQKTHVWNIFDEFACFVGIQRHEFESNESLTSRILYTTKNLPNNTEEGLKHSIISEIMDYANDITIDDIKIEKITPENLVKPYKEYNNVLDMLSSLNRDVLKDKKWDLDKWSYNFKSISFLDNVWDDVVEEYQNGIGYNDDLKVVIADEDNNTDAEIVLYNKSIEKLEKYVQNKEINKNINFKLKRYENVLKSTNVKYNIQASEAVDITNENIKLAVYESNDKKETVKIEEIYKLGKDIVAIDNSKITDSNSYRLEFYANDDYDTMKVSKAKVIYKHKTTGEITETRNLLKAAPGFTINASGELVNTSIKKTIKSINHFNEYSGLIDGENGITITNGVNEGKGIVNVSGLGLNIVRVNYEHVLVDMPKSMIDNNQYCYWNDNNELIFRTDINQEKKFEIDTEANEISFKIVEGEVDLFINRDGETTYQKLKAPAVWKSLVSDTPSKIKIVAVNNSNLATKFSDFKYSCHSIDLKLKYGQLIKEEDGYRLPNFSLNDLIITLSSKSSSYPIVKSLYIGGDTRQLKYQTEIIEPKINMDRIIEVTTTGLTNLLHVDTVGNTIYSNENYVPAISYKATKDNAWIRLNTDEYDSINEITTDIGSIHAIEESGKTYYNVVLKNGQIVNSVTITGIKNTPMKTITLHDMVKFYFKDFNPMEDSIYASKLCKGLIIADNDPDNPRNLIINIKSEIFKGIDANLYKFIEIPNYLTTSFNSSTSSTNDIQTTSSFDSISFIPGGAKLYNAINESYIYTNELRNIKILNNFNPILASNQLMYYEVSPYSSDIDCDVRFDNSVSNVSFNDLLNWSLGMKDIAIKTPMDLSNTENYEITELEISDDVLLNRYIELKKSYKLSNNDEIFINKYMIIPPQDCEVLYERYSDTENSNLIIQEEVIMEEDGFTKLMYSNVDTLLYVGFSPYSGENIIEFNDYNLLKDEGIITWTNQTYINAARKVYLRYTIKNPVAILLNEDELYKSIGYNIDAYEEINRVKLTGISDGYRFDLQQISGYDEADLVYTQCSSASFQSEGDNNIITFNKTVDKETILVKTGYYYINGKEYYLFPSEDQIVIDEEKFIDMENVEISGGEISLVKTTNNYIRNSEMLFRGMNELYNYDATKSDLKGVSTVNTLTACDSFNNWKTFGMKIMLKEGYNQWGLHFSSEIQNGYAFLEITDYLQNGNNYLSFWADNTLEVYIGEEKKYLGLEFHDSINIKLSQEIPYRNNSFREAIITKKDNVRTYLIVKNYGVIDDIILNTDMNGITSHIKNINLLGLNITEEYKTGQSFRMFIDNNKYNINKGASLTKNGYIKTASNIYWGISPIKTYETKEDFKTCNTLNVHFENDYIKTNKTEGYIETAPIFLDNTSTIKRLIFKINEVSFDNMKGMKVQILSSNTRTGDYIPINSFNDNYGYVYGDSLLRYIKLKITMPEEKCINNFSIYCEYKSTKDNAPKVLMPSTGYLISKIYDAQYSTDYKLRSINIEDISNINDVEIQIRALRDEYSADVWQPWKTIKINSSLKLEEEILFEKSRFFQIKVVLKTSTAVIKINNLNIDVV